MRPYTWDNYWSNCIYRLLGYSRSGPDGTNPLLRLFSAAKCSLCAQRSHHFGLRDCVIRWTSQLCNPDPDPDNETHGSKPHYHKHTALLPLLTKTRGIDPMLVYCWLSVVDAGPTVNQHWTNASCSRGSWLAFNVTVSMSYCRARANSSNCLLFKWAVTAVCIWQGNHRDALLSVSEDIILTNDTILSWARQLIGF